jgi:hypothetical protein
MYVAKYYTFPPLAQHPLVGQGLYCIKASRSHFHSLGLLWTSDQPVAENSDNEQHSRQTHIRASRGIRNRSPSKRAAADPRLTPRGHWHRQILHIYPTQIYGAQGTLFIARQCHCHTATDDLLDNKTAVRSWILAGSRLTKRPDAEGESPESNDKFLLDTVFFQTWKTWRERPMKMAVSTNTDDRNQTGVYIN